MRFVIVAFTILLLATGLAWALAEFGWSFKVGIVTDKWYEERREWDTRYPIYMNVCSSGPNGTQTCTTTIVGWGTTHHVDDEDWVIVVRGCQENRPDKCRGERWELSREKWESIEVGDRVDRDTQSVVQ